MVNDVHDVAFADLSPGVPVGPLELVVSVAANARYRQAAGVDHPALTGGALYPPIAANLTVLAFQATCAEPVIQTHQRLVCHRKAHAGTRLRCEGRILRSYAKRGRAYVDVEVVVTTVPDGAPLWTSEAGFTPVATLGPRR